MQSIKTIAIVILLLAVLYGVHTVMTQPEQRPPRDAAEAARELPDELTLDLGTVADSSDDASPPEVAVPDWTPATADTPPRPAAITRANESPLALIAVPDVPDLVDQSNADDTPPPTAAEVATPLGSNENEFRPPSVENPVTATDVVAPVPSAADAIERFPTTPLPSAPQLGAVPGAGPVEASAKEFVEGVRMDPKVAALDRGWRTAQESLKQGQWRQALGTLSALYADPRLSHEERLRLLETLDPLAGRVVYSTEHLLEGPYEVRRGDTLMSIAGTLDVPWQLLRNINGVADPEFLVPGSKLKVVRGPFRAEVDLAAQEVTIYLQRLYAGRFPISVGSEPAPRIGDYEVQRKDVGRQFYAPNGVVLPAGDARNPYGRCWIDLGSELSIHGSAIEAGGPVTSGCIGLSPKDADDVFAILSPGSRVSIR